MVAILPGTAERAQAYGMLAVTNADEIAAILFIDIAVIVVAARLAAAVSRRLGQPAVIGEIVAGILLGPSLLGAFPGQLTTTLFPIEVRPFLKVVAQLGLILFMFIVGLELDPGLLRKQRRAAALISLSSIALPFALGIALAVAIHPSHDVVRGRTVAFWPFALFIGASMSITAFPVLARILADRGMFHTRIGALALACAAIDDVMAWSLLAVVVAVIASTGVGDLPRILILSLLFVAAMHLVVKPVLDHVVAGRYRQAKRLTPDILAIVLAGVLASSYVTAWIGIHQIFGAFIFGTAMPREATHGLLGEIVERLESVTVLLLLPVFFVVTGLEADVRSMGTRGIGELGLILLVACVGKFVGASLAARFQRLTGRQAMTIGILMNTRGLTELVILNVGLAFGVLDRDLFTMLVIMALVTTVMATPLLRVVYPDRVLVQDRVREDEVAIGPRRGRRVLIAVGDPTHAHRMAEIAVDLLVDDRPAELVLTRFTPRTQE
ncbi:MAG TPA: cation:proton antiporter, partial [Actinomycetota bacterium]|nr:cation:proton antiporter [Actinomycetota bacterium]